MYDKNKFRNVLNVSKKDNRTVVNTAQDLHLFMFLELNFNSTSRENVNHFCLTILSYVN